MLLAAIALLAAADPSAAGRISGKVTVAGLAPKLPNLPVTRDLKICGSSKPDESLEVGPGGGVKNAVLWLADAPPAPKKPAAAEKKPKLDQQTCAFVPHVLPVPVGTTIDVVNSDNVLHNVRAVAAGTTLFNYAMPIKNHVVPTRLTKEGFYRVTCDVHPWMRAWIAVLPTQSFTVSGADGTFTLDHVPPGKHKLRLWHERLGEREEDVEMVAGGTATRDIALNPR